MTIPYNYLAHNKKQISNNQLFTHNNHFFSKYLNFSFYLCQTIMIEETMIHIDGIKDEMIANNLTPYRFTHPGEIIKDELEDRGISQREFAQNVGMSYSVLNELLNAHRPLTTNTALLFEAALGLPAELLMRIQTKYNLQMARKDKDVIRWMAKIRNAAAVL